MLKPFQIRDLHVPIVEENLYDSSTESAVSEPRDGSSRHGTIRLSAPEYDKIASNHPRARLTYMDDDDGEIITVSPFCPSPFSLVWFLLVDYSRLGLPSSLPNA